MRVLPLVVRELQRPHSTAVAELRRVFAAGRCREPQRTANRNSEAISAQSDCRKGRLNVRDAQASGERVSLSSAADNHG